MKYRYLLAMIVSILISVSNQAQARADKIVLASPFAPLVMPMAYILDNGLLSEIAEKTELKIWNNPDQLRAMMITGEVDFASVPSNVASLFYNKGVKLKLVDVSIWGVMYIVSQDVKISSLSDLKGQQIYVPFRGDQPDLVFQTIAKHQGLDPMTDFDVQYVASPLDIVMGLLAGQVKNALLIEPVSSMVIMKGKSKGKEFRRVIDIQKELGKIDGWQDRFPNAGVVALPSILQNANAVEVFSKAYEEAVKWTVSHPKEASELAAKYVEGINAEAFEESLKYTQFEAIKSGKVKEEIENMFDAFKALNPKSIGGELPDADFYYP